ncbi:hypothetical protein RYH80_04520 [Halobaculum sp. MBLA0147]|uniref:hypothetical protein n=1 Tax=Halobaculum sp. MBLA0147 TaxID=3079934 RepID=UPI003524C513
MVGDTVVDTDTDATWLRYGEAAEPLDEPGRTFGVLDDGESLTYGTFPTGFVGRPDVDLHEQDAGRILVGEVDEDLYRRFGAAFSELDPGDLAADVANTTLFTRDEAAVVILCGWFDLPRDRAATALSYTETEVTDLVRSARHRRRRARATAEITFGVGTTTDEETTEE